MRDLRHPDDLLSAFLDDELDEAAASRVQDHVLECERCMTELDGLRAARSVLRGLPEVDQPDELFATVPAAAAAGDDHRWGRTATMGLLAMLTGILAVAFAMGETDQGDVVPPVEVMVVDHVVRTGGGPVLQPVDLDR